MHIHVRIYPDTYIQHIYTVQFICTYTDLHTASTHACYPISCFHILILPTNFCTPSTWHRKPMDPSQAGWHAEVPLPLGIQRPCNSDSYSVCGNAKLAFLMHKHTQMPQFCCIPVHTIPYTSEDQPHICSRTAENGLATQDYVYPMQCCRWQ